MRKTRIALLAAAALMTTAASPAWSHGRGHHHHGGHVRFGIVLGGPIVQWPHARYRYAPGPYYPRTVVVQEPPVYIERGDAPEAASSSTGYWYYCRGDDMYYPYTKHCPGGWERVSPQPPG